MASWTTGQLEVAKIKKAGTVWPVCVARPNFNLSTANRMFTAMPRKTKGAQGDNVGELKVLIVDDEPDGGWFPI